MMLQIASLIFLLLTGVSFLTFAYLVTNAELSSLMLPEMAQTMVKEVILPRGFLVTGVFLVPAVVLGVMARKSPEAPASKKSR